MKEIKFRIWDVKKEKFRTPDFFAITGDGALIQTETQWWDVVNEDITLDFIVQHYIGRKDTKGRDIYEGDIVFVELTGPCETSKPVLGTIVWNEEEYCFGIETKVAGEDVVWDFMYTELKVIGNIFETPELLSL